MGRSAQSATQAAKYAACEAARSATPVSVPSSSDARQRAKAPTWTGNFWIQVCGTSRRMQCENAQPQLAQAAQRAVYTASLTAHPTTSARSHVALSGTDLSVK